MDVRKSHRSLAYMCFLATLMAGYSLYVFGSLGTLPDFFSRMVAFGLLPLTVIPELIKFNVYKVSVTNTHLIIRDGFFGSMDSEHLSDIQDVDVPNNLTNLIFRISDLKIKFKSGKTIFIRGIGSNESKLLVESLLSKSSANYVQYRMAKEENR